MVVFRVTSAYFAIPIKRKTNLIQLFAVVIDIGFGRDCWVLTSLNGILFSGKSIGIVAHWIENIESLQAFETRIDVTCDVA